MALFWACGIELWRERDKARTRSSVSSPGRCRSDAKFFKASNHYDSLPGKAPKLKAKWLIFQIHALQPVLEQCWHLTEPLALLSSMLLSQR